jgi:hypothetical protein
LEQAKEYFRKAFSILSLENNNNIQWHQAIRLIETADNLRVDIT